MSTMYEFDDYKIILMDTGRTDSYNKSIVKYTFLNPDNKVIFEGDDLSCSPLHESESLECAKDLLGFLTCQLGDVEDEYFKNYTNEQIAFRDSFDCEQLQIYTYDED